jgi:hypothetical protein
MMRRNYGNEEKAAGMTKVVCDGQASPGKVDEAQRNPPGKSIKETKNPSRCLLMIEPGSHLPLLKGEKEGFLTCLT